MELDRYLRGLAQRWYLVVFLIGVGLLGSWGYMQWSGGASWGNFRWDGASNAVATVAVLEPTVTRALNGQQAQVNFASIVESLALSERVVNRLRADMTADALKGKITVKLGRTLVPNVSMPIYSVKVENPDPQRALDLCNTVIEEARLMFLEMNQLDRSQVDGSLQAEETRLRQEADAARAALRTFQEENRVWKLNSQLDAQIALVNSLRQSSILEGVSRTASSAARNDLQRALSEAQAELERVRGLQPEYERLAFEVSLASAAVTQLSSRESDVALLNDPQAQQTVQTEAEAARIRLAQARANLSAFQRSNAIGDLPSELATRTATVSELRRQQLTAAAASGGLKEVLAPEEAELQRLLPLVPLNDELTSRLSLAEAQLTQLVARKFDLVLASTLPPAVQLKVLDAPRIQSNLLWTVILYALGAVLGAFVGLLIVYLVTYYDRCPQTVAEVQELTGSVVLVRLPRAY
ncbi:MAG TPA: hypothetical protein VHS99_16265 [Chloroflexota bacterium]|nr:hypothetical protein [Chloroflexota bacterium]